MTDLFVGKGKVRKGVAFIAEGTSLRESTSFESFCVKVCRGPLGPRSNKVRKSREVPIGMMCRRQHGA